MNKINKFAGLIAVIAIVIAIIGVYTPAGKVVTNTVTKVLGGVTNYDSLTLGNDLIVNGTTTMATSPDGFVFNKSAMTVATTTMIRGYVQNTGNDVMCDGDSGFLYANDTGAWAPSFIYSLNESATLTSGVSITASTTVATSTDTVTAMATAPFVFEHGNYLVLGVADYVNEYASSTYWGNWALEFGVHCWTLGQ